MVVGFNHNVMYKAEVFHVQTEDSGMSNPQITTLLYREGTILASKKTSYADIIKIDGLEKVVEELMKEQHKDMLRNLKNGEFDDRIAKRSP
jgi:ketol-acid reductoisomerase